MKTNQLQKNILNYWPEVGLTDIGSFSKGAGISKDQLVEKGHNAVRYGELYTRHHFQIKKIYSFIPDSIIPETKKIKYGDILFAGSGETIDEIGKSAAYLLDQDCYAGGDLIIFRPKNANSLFLSYFLNIGEARKKLRELGQGQSVVHIYKSDIEKLKLHLPSLPEQNRIVSVLETWDKAIEKLTNKIELKKNIKKGLMKRLLTGELRLAGFSEPWSYIKIKNLAGLVKGDKSKGGDDGYLEIGDVDINSKNYNIVGKEKLTVPGAIKVPRGTLLISTVRPTRGAITITKESIFVSSAFCKLKIDNLFTYFIVNSETFLNYLGDSSGGGTYPTCKNEDVLEYEFLAPVVEEERIAIANILKTAEQEVEVLERKLNYFKEQKKYLLNNLITGAIRTPETMKIKS